MNISERINKLLNKGGNQVFKESIDSKLSIPEQAEHFYRKVYGLTPVKENLFRTIISVDQINALVIGKSGSGKTVLMDVTRENCNNVVYIDCANTSGAGIISLLQANQKADIVILDEIDKLNKKDQTMILGFLNNGWVEKNLKNEKIKFHMNCKVLATSNSISKLGAALRNRFVEFHIREYTDEEFVECIKFCLNGKFLDQTAEIIAKVLIAYERKDVRAAITISRWIQPKDSVEDITRVIENWVTNLASEAVDYN